MAPYRERLKRIRDALSSEEILAMLAEEAAELAQAALKLRRALDGTDPTPRTVDECRKSLIEELSDVLVVCDALPLEPDRYLMDRKLARWTDRLFLKENLD